MRYLHRFARWILFGGLIATAACGNGGDRLANPADSPYHPLVDPAAFTASTTVDNPYFPLVPGTVLVYEGAGQRVVVTVEQETRVVMGIECVVVHDQVYEDGELVEDTFDWYAQDDDGNVWYLGEDSREIRNGEPVSAKGSWEAGVDGALPGIIMLARPLAGLWYRQEYYEGEAEDMAQVLSLNETVTVPAGTFAPCILTLETNGVEPGVEEHKWLAPGVGVVREQEIKGGSERAELVEIRRP